jgi:hypothetical protein
LVAVPNVGDSSLSLFTSLLDGDCLTAQLSNTTHGLVALTGSHWLSLFCLSVKLLLGLASIAILPSGFVENYDESRGRSFCVGATFVAP